MVAWLDNVLAAIIEVEDNSATSVSAYEHAEWAIEQAHEYGNLDPLNEQLQAAGFPDLMRAGLLQRPKRAEKGDRFAKSPDQKIVKLGEELTCAAFDVRRIRAIWKKAYNGRKPKGYKTPEEYAADRWDIDDLDKLTDAKRNRQLLRDEFLERIAELDFHTTEWWPKGTVSWPPRPRVPERVFYDGQPIAELRRGRWRILRRGFAVTGGTSSDDVRLCVTRNGQRVY